jgi:hypothetical protein
LCKDINDDNTIISEGQGSVTFIEKIRENIIISEGQGPVTFIEKIRDNVYIFRHVSSEFYINFYLSKKEFENLIQLIEIFNAIG